MDDKTIHPDNHKAMSDVASNRQSLDPDFKYDIKLNEQEYMNNPGKDRFIVDDNEQIIQSDIAPELAELPMNNEKMKLGTLSQRSFPLVPSVSSKSYKEVDYSAFNGWRNTQTSHTNSKNIYQATTNDLLATSNIATQSYSDGRDAKFIGSQFSSYSLGRDLLIKQLINTSISNKMKQEDIPQTNKDIFTAVLNKYKQKKTSLIPEDQDELVQIEECMQKWKIFSPEPLNDYNEKLLEEVKKMIDQMRGSIAEIDNVLSNQNSLFESFGNEILGNQEVINHEEDLENYKINFLNHNVNAVQDIANKINVQLEIIGNSIEKNNDEVVLLKKVFEDTERLLKSKLKAVKIFKNEKSGNLTGAEFIQLYLPNNSN